MATGDFKVEIKGLDELRSAFKRAPKIVEPILQRTVEAAQFTLQKHTLKNDPVPWRTGNLLQSFRFFKARLQARWMPTAHYAVYVHEPRAAKGEGGKGYAGNPYMDAIVQKSQGDIDKLFESALERIVQELAK